MKRVSELGQTFASHPFNATISAKICWRRKWNHQPVNSDIATIFFIKWSCSIMTSSDIYTCFGGKDFDCLNEVFRRVLISIRCVYGYVLVKVAEDEWELLPLFSYMCVSKTWRLQESNITTAVHWVYLLLLCMYKNTNWISHCIFLKFQDSTCYFQTGSVFHYLQRVLLQSILYMNILWCYELHLIRQMPNIW